MTDREKVIRGLEACRHDGCNDKSCPYARDERCVELLCYDALILLKEQEPDCRVCGQSSCRYYHETRKPKECGSYVRYEPDLEGR